MADKFDKPGKASPNPPGPKKGAAPSGTPSRFEQAQKLAQSRAGRKATPPGQFFQEAWAELKKTTWPDRNTLTKSTTVVLALVLATAIFVGVLDAALGRIMNPLFNVRVR